MDDFLSDEELLHLKKFVVIRGGSYLNTIQHSISTLRESTTPASFSWLIGFRLVVIPKQKE